MHKTVKKGGSWKSAIKRRRTRKKISNIRLKKFLHGLTC